MLLAIAADPHLTDVRNEERQTHFDLETHQEEADIIIQQMLKHMREAHQIAVILDDAGVLVMLLHHYQMCC